MVVSSESGFDWPVRVYIEDTDAGGIVFYANYLKYMERARTEWARANGVNLRGRLQEGVSYVVQSLSLQYHRPARLDDELLVSARVESYARTWFQFDQVVIRSRDSERLVSGLVKVVCTDLESGRPRRLDPELREALVRARV